MAYPVWQPGTLYQPGDIVVPITAPSPTATAVENGDFSAGASNWDFTGAAFYSTHVSKGGWRTAVELPGNQPSGGALNQTKLVVPVGKKITATCLIDQGASIAGATRGWVEVHWFSGTDVLLRVDKGNQVDSGAGGAVHPSTCESTCPEGAAYCRAGIELWSVADHNHAVWGGNLQVDGTFAGLPSDLAYKAVQPESGFSDASEPAWPPVLGQQVVDNEVTWEAIAATRVVWTAEPLYVSGDTEPEWPEEEGGMVKDGTVTLRAVSRRVEDPNCPNTKIVAIAASKVFCGDDDIVRYSATVNPLDWSSDNDAGYLPTGLQNYGSNPVEAMGLYRGNLIVFNAEAFQLWQVDEDPANMALLDALPMGSTQHHAIAPVSNDLFFLASQGVRTVGIAASSTNFQAGDVGMPIDSLVQAAMGEVGVEPMALYYPAMGQYWLVIRATPEPKNGPSISGEANDAYIDLPYAFTYTVVAGDAPISRTIVVSGALLPGLSWNETTATISGTPTEAGTMSLLLRTIDQNGLWAELEDVILVLDVPEDIVEAFASAEWSLPMIGPGPTDCPMESYASFTLTGDGSLVYEVPLRISGSVESNQYVGGIIFSDHFMLGGGVSGALPVTNIYRLIISDPPATYYMNHIDSTSSFRLEYDEVPLTVRIAGNATVELIAESIDGKQTAPAQWMRAEVVL